MIEFLQGLPASTRKSVYAGYAILGVAMGAVQIGYLASDIGDPVWLKVSLAVYGFLGTAMGVTAHVNVPDTGR